MSKKDTSKTTGVEPSSTENKEVKVQVKVAPPPTYGLSSHDSEQYNMTDVYDDGDIASALEMGFVAHALERHKEKLAPESHPDFDGEHCVDCDIVLPVLRLEMGKVRCVDCQTLLEKNNKLHGRR